MPAPGNPSPRVLDVTYILFLVAGSVTELIFCVITLDPKNAEGWGMLLGPTIGLVGIAALLGGIVRGFWCWRHRPLLFLALSPMLIIVDAGIQEFAAAYFPVSIWGLTLILVPVWWFAKGKQHYRENLALEDLTTQLPIGSSEGPESRR